MNKHIGRPNLLGPEPQRVTFDMEAGIHRRLSDAALAKGVSVASVLRWAVQDYLNAQDTRQRKDYERHKALDEAAATKLTAFLVERDAKNEPQVE